jgi:hypothetical protein
MTNFIKKKYIKLSDPIMTKMRAVAGRGGDIGVSLEYFGYVKLNNSLISEELECKPEFIIPKEKVDEFLYFSIGKKPLLIEKNLSFNIKYDLAKRYNKNKNIEFEFNKIIMSNGNSYITIS